MKRSIVFLTVFLAAFTAAAIHAGAFESSSIFFTPHGMKALGGEESLFFRKVETPQVGSEALGKFVIELLAAHPCEKAEFHPEREQQAVQKSI